MKEEFKEWLRVVLMPILVGTVGIGGMIGLVFARVAEDKRQEQYVRDNTVTSGVLLDGLPVEGLTVRTYEVTRTVYLDAEGREVFRREDALERKE
jgi:hypothetical protein